MQAGQQRQEKQGGESPPRRKAVPQEDEGECWAG